MNGVRLIKEEVVKKSRTDSLRDYYWQLDMWAISPLWLIVELTCEYLFGEMWTHDKGKEVVLVKYSVDRRIGEFCTTKKRFEWLRKYKFFESKVFADRATSIKELKRLEAYARKNCN